MIVKSHAYIDLLGILRGLFCSYCRSKLLYLDEHIQEARGEQLSNTAEVSTGCWLRVTFSNLRINSGG